MATQDSEARRVSLIFGTLTVITTLLIGTIIVAILAITTGNGLPTLIFGLIPTAALAAGCGTVVTRQTQASLQPVIVAIPAGDANRIA